MKRTWNLVTVQGHNVEHFNAQLDSQQTPIRTVTVDNTNSYGITVKVYPGLNSEVIITQEGPLEGTIVSQFPPYIVVPGRTVSISVDGPSSVSFYFSGPAHDDVNKPINGTPLGNIYISVSGEEQREAFDGSIAATASGVQVDIPNPLPVTGTVGIDPTTLPNPQNVIVQNPQNNPVPITGTGTGTPISVTGQVLIDTTVPLDTKITNTPLEVTVPSTSPISVEGTVGITPSPLPISGNVGVTGVVATQITGPFPIQAQVTNTPLPVDASASTAPIIVAPNPVQYPPASLGTRINSFYILSVASNTSLPIQLLTQPSTGLAAYFTSIYIWGFDRQPTIEWIFQSRNNAGAYIPIFRGWGDKSFNYSGPYFYCPAVNVNQGIFLNVVNNNAIMATIQVRIMLMGWWQ